MKNSKEYFARLDAIGRNVAGQRINRNLEKLEKNMRQLETGHVYFSHKEAEKLDTSLCPSVSELDTIVKITVENSAEKTNQTATKSRVKSATSQMDAETLINLDHVRECPKCKAFVSRQVIEIGKETLRKEADRRRREKEMKQDLV